MSEHNGLPRRRWFGLFPNSPLLRCSLRCQSNSRNSCSLLNACSVLVLAAYLPWVRGRIPEGGAVMTRHVHTCTGDASGGGITRLDRGGLGDAEIASEVAMDVRAVDEEEESGGEEDDSEINQRGAYRESTVESTVKLRNTVVTTHGLSLGRGGLTWGGRNNFKTKPRVDFGLNGIY